MQEKNINNPLIYLLIQPRFRIIRHLVLIVFTLGIAMGFIWHMLEEKGQLGPLQQYGGLFLFTSVFLGGSYLNIYVLTPRLLLRNKWILYFCSLSGLVALVIIVVILFQMLLSEDRNSSGDLNYMVLFINLLSSSLSIFLLFAGTTTIVLFSHWIQDTQQASELESATMQLELELLENQINPHFLFNMLNNANIMIKTNPDMAEHIIAKLEEMLRYQMDESSREKVYLEEEMAFLNDFLELEKIRRDFLDYTISIEGNIENIQIPPLLFITFVENAVKHNVDSRAPSYVHIRFIVTGRVLTFICENSVPKQALTKQTGGIGLVNVRRRLDLLYNNDYSLEQIKTDTKYTVKLELNL